MKLIRYIKNLFFCLWAVSVLWIMIGSLVNFHQHKIWGKPLQSQFMCTKRDKEDSIDLHKLLNKNVTHGASPFCGVLPDHGNFHFSVSSQILICTGSSDIIPVSNFNSSGLRAPPVS